VCGTRLVHQEYTARPGGHKVLSIGAVPQAALATFFKRFQKHLAKAQKRTGDKRSAAGGKQGHQKTPAFIEAILMHTMEEKDWMALCEIEPLATDKEDEDESNTDGGVAPRGGFTDVGLHTGGKARSTPWPLVQAVLQVQRSVRVQLDLTRGSG
jgi:hypothetical protein